MCYDILIFKVSGQQKINDKKIDAIWQITKRQVWFIYYYLFSFAFDGTDCQHRYFFLRFSACI